MKKICSSVFISDSRHTKKNSRKNGSFQMVCDGELESPTSTVSR